VADYKKQLLDKIAARTARVGVIGLGYVGLPLVVEFAHNGFNAMGFEVDARKSDAVNRGESYIPDVPTSQVAELVATGKLSATTDFSLLKEQDIIIICVPTPLRKTKDPDVSYILAASEKIKASLRSGQLVILESTTYPGTTDEVLKPIFDETGLKLDEDYFLAFSPERVDPGNERFNTKNITKVVGGVSQTSADVAGATYAAIVDKVHAVSSARVAEACKLLENTFRAVNIGLVNELALLCDTLGIDTWEVIGAAATKPFGFMAFYPGPGIGGHCLTGAETAVIRKAGGTQERVERLSDLFAEQYADDTNATFEFENGHVVQNPRLEALSINPEKHRPEWKPVSYLFRRAYQGKLVTITTSDNRRLTVTNEHPMLVSDADGQMCQMFAKDVAVGDRLPIHFRAAGDLAHFGDSLADPEIDLLPLLPPEMKERIRLRIIGGSWREYRATLKKRLKADVVQELMHQDYLPLSDYLAMEEADEIFIPHESLMLCTGRGPSFATFPAVTRITPAVARLIGYYLAEGCITQENSRDRVRLSFNRAEHEFISDVRAILEKELGVQSSVSDSRIDQVTHIRAASSVLGWLLADVLNCGRGSLTMRIPDVLLGASTVHQCELLRGLLRGDGDVYVDTGAQSYRKNGRSYISQNASAEIGYFSSSPQLFQQVIYLLQNLGFTPTFKRTKPHLQLKGFSQINQMRDWLGTKGAKLEDYFAAHQRVNASRTFKQFGNLMTVPVKSVEIHDTEQPVEVYSLEVEDNHTFTTSYGLYVHNCIPLDPHYLSWKARMHGFEARFISLAEEVNSRMPDHVVELVTRGLNEHRKAVNGSKVLILGVAYKRDIDDMRESPALGIIEKLQDLGAEVQFHDPYVAEVHLEGHDQIVKGTALTSELVADADCVVIVTDHRNANIDYGWVCERARLVVDTRNATRALTDERFNGKIIRL
jgi:UDP-N-acetyl-D-mannosaminuronate dehydrogenase